MKRLTYLLAVVTCMFLFSACGQSGPLYIPGNPSQMAVPPSKGAATSEKTDDEEQDTSELPDPE
jgi:predicted small lipoprotein YifL